MKQISEIDITKTFWIFLAGLTALRLIYLLFIPVTPQEAYYWYYSQYPALSFFDHPPMAAYSIWVGTHIFGNTVFGVKFIGVFWSALTNILIFFTAKKAVGVEQDTVDISNAHILPLVAVLFYNLTIFAHIYAVSTMPDTPLLFFWMSVLFSVQQALLSGKNYWWLLAGIALGFGLVSKYTMIAIVPSVFIYLLISNKYRYHLIRPWPYLALIFAAIVFYPVVYWNQQHDWASFIFQFGERAESVKSIRFKYLGQLIGSQMFMLTPLIFILFFVALWKMIRSWKKYSILKFFFVSAVLITGGFILISFKSLVKMNWLLPGYFGLIILTVVLLHKNLLKFSGWIKAGMVFSIILILFSHLIWLIPNVPLGEGNTWSGWKDTARQVYEIQSDLGGREQAFIFANSYKSASLMKFYLPDQQDVYAQNVYGQPALQFDFWPLPDSLNGKDALYIFTNRHEYRNDLKKVRPYFDEVGLYKKFEYQFVTGQKTRTIFCYLAKNYHKDGQKEIP